MKKIDHLINEVLKESEFRDDSDVPDFLKGHAEPDAKATMADIATRGKTNDIFIMAQKLVDLTDGLPKPTSATAMAKYNTIARTLGKIYRDLEDVYTD
jgi:hypothetical protein